MVRKRIIFSSIFTILVLLCSYCVSSVQMQAVQASVEKTMETSVAENDALMSSLFSMVHTGINNGLLFLLTQVAKMYHSFSFCTSPVIYPFFEWLTLSFFSMYTASSILPVSFANSQINAINTFSGGLPTMVTIPLSILWISVVMVEMMLFMKYTSIFVFLFLLVYTYILPYWTEFCYYTSF